MQTIMFRSGHADDAAAAPIYDPALLERLQDVLASVAELGFTHERALEDIERSDCPAPIKDALRDQSVADFARRRAAYDRELLVLESRIRRLFST